MPPTLKYARPRRGVKTQLPTPPTPLPPVTRRPHQNFQKRPHSHRVRPQVETAQTAQSPGVTTASQQQLSAQTWVPSSPKNTSTVTPPTESRPYSNTLTQIFSLFRQLIYTSILWPTNLNPNPPPCASMSSHSTSMSSTHTSSTGGQVLGRRCYDAPPSCRRHTWRMSLTRVTRCGSSVARHFFLLLRFLTIPRHCRYDMICVPSNDR